VTNVRRRLGVLIPSSNTVVEDEFARYLPSGITLHVSRMPISADVTVKSLLEMAAASVASARLLTDCRPDLILYACTSGSFVKGKAFYEQVEEDIYSATGIPTLSTSRCILEALQESNSKKVAVYTPYVDEVNSRARAFLEAHGFEVTGLYGMGLVDNLSVGDVEPAEVFRFVFEQDRRGADAAIISCTNLRTLDVIEPLEKVLGAPVVSSNQASLAGVLRHLGI
jgi:maleate isomerase